MRKVWNSLRYGSSKTKTYLYSMILIFAGSMVFFLLAIGFASTLFGLLGILLLGLDFAVFQSVSFEEMINNVPAKEEKEKKKRYKEKIEQGQGKKTGEELVSELGIKALEAREDKESSLESLDEKSLKKIMIKYKVKKEHKKIMVDQSQSFRIRQCPAYLWKTKREVFLLLLEEEPRIVKIPLSKINSIGYQKMVASKPTLDYEELQKSSILTRFFSEFLPSYREGIYRGKMGSYKNLYVITPDICVTNTSAKNLFEVLQVDFVVHDEVTDSKNYGDCYKEAYKQNILWKDGVITTQEYKERIKNLLTHVAKEQLSKQVYEELLLQLVSHKLITEEYASYYRAIRKEK